ncbi:hypothetical protein LTR33_012144 [Friedmanniomyces endolithicus]|nr:hypothetical protein LTR33_012144 [Friedmanniomyces endolithicus]
MATALADAKNLGLHMIDSPRNKVREDTQANIIAVEMGRRVWWHLVSTDLSAAVFGGPHDSVYSVNPSHMSVKKPRNMTDEDLLTMPADFSRPLDQLTSTSHYLQRIELAEICREVADTLLEIRAFQDPSQIPYSRIMTIDDKFAEILTGPLVSGAATAEHAAKYSGDRPHLRQQYFTYLTTEARRCKLHLSYLLRLSQDSQYTFSRNVCLQSARNILRLKHILPSEVSEDSTASLKMIGLIHHFCCAIVILAMDLCVNKSLGSEYERKAEIRDACKTLEDARESSESAGMFLESLTAIFRKRDIRLENDQPAKDNKLSTEFPSQHTFHQQTADYRYRGRFGVGLFPADYMHVANDGSPEIPEPEPDFDSIWQSYLDLDAEVQAWDALAG